MPIAIRRKGKNAILRAVLTDDEARFWSLYGHMPADAGR